MANPKIVPKKSTVAGRVPTTADLGLGEICVNSADLIIYYRQPDTGNIVILGAGVSISANPPANPSAGALWIEESSLRAFVYYDNAWVEIVGQKGDKGDKGDTGASGASTWADIAGKPTFSTVATSGSYTDLLNKPTLGTAAATDSSAYATAAQGTKADTASQPGHTHTLSQLTQSGATSGQVPTWSGSAWVPQSPTFFQAYEHFITGGGIGLLGLTYAGLNGGSITQVTTNPAVFGAVRMATANNTTANTGARINGSGSINNLNPTGVGEFRYVSRIMRFSTDFFSSTTRGIFRTGLGDVINANPTNGFFFSCQETNAVNFNTVSGGVTTSTPTGFSITKDQWNLFEFTISANGSSVTAKINGNTVATHTTNIPSAYMFPITNLLKYQADAGLVQLDVDYIYISLIQ